MLQVVRVLFTRRCREISSTLMFYDRYLRWVPVARTYCNDSERFSNNWRGRHDAVDVSATVLRNLRLVVQRVPVQQTRADVSTVRLHWRVGHNRWSVIQQFVWTRILSTNTLSRSVSAFEGSRKINFINPLTGTGNYSATSNNMKLVNWSLMGGL